MKSYPHHHKNYSIQFALTSKILCFLGLFLFTTPIIFAQSSSEMISFDHSEDYFTLVGEESVAPLIISNKDYPGIAYIAGWFSKDIENVSGKKPALVFDEIPSVKEIVVIGTLGNNPVIDMLVAEKKIDVSAIEGKWEATQIEVVENPFENVEKAFVIVGSDKRGTIYGMFDISENIGVSPWYWWADVPIRKNNKIYVKPGRYTIGSPKVKYRGIFIKEWKD